MGHQLSAAGFLLSKDGRTSVFPRCFLRLCRDFSGADFRIAFTILGRGADALRSLVSLIKTEAWWSAGVCSSKVLVFQQLCLF